MNIDRSYQVFSIVLIAMVLASLTSISTVTAQELFPQYVEQLTGTNSADAANAAVTELKKGGTNAFPVMVHHLGDLRPFNGTGFVKEAVVLTSTNALIRELSYAGVGAVEPDPAKGERWEPFSPWVGSVCFDILRGQIEYSWGKVFEDCHVLTPSNAGEWLRRHAGLPLCQLRIEAAKETLQIAESKLSGKPYDDFLSLLRTNLADAQKAARICLEKASSQPLHNSSKSGDQK